MEKDKVESLVKFAAESLINKAVNTLGDARTKMAEIDRILEWATKKTYKETE